MKYIFFFISFLCLGIVLVMSYAIISSKPPPMEQKLRSLPAITSFFSLENAPRLSLRGSIATMSGQVEWQSRIATQPAQLLALQILQQGETIVTGEGTITMVFPNTGTIRLLPNTELDFLQTLPANVVIAQNKGEGIYTKEGSIPLSIRALHLLVNHEEGVMDVVIDDEEGMVTVSMVSGKAKAAYEDSDLVSIVLDITEGQTLTFDNPTKTASIEP